MIWPPKFLSTTNAGVDYSTRRESLTLRGLPQSVKARHRAFTLIELLVVIAIIAILAAILMPVLNAAKLKGQGIQCVNNMRQLMIAFKMYSNENNGYFPLNMSLGAYTDNGNWALPNINWVAGQQNYSGVPDNTNYALLMNSQETQLAPYAPNPAVYRCPADQSKSGPSTGLMGPPRIRSYSMSCAAGCTDLKGDPQNVGGGSGNLGDLGGTWRAYNRESTVIGAVGPSDLWVLIDENPDSIDDGYFLFYMPFGSTEYWFNFPSKLHINSTGMCFEDGHAEIHRWLQPGNIKATTYQSYDGGSPGPGVLKDPDLSWFASHTSCTAQ